MEKTLTILIEENKNALAKLIVDSGLPAIVWKDSIFPPILNDLKKVSEEQYKQELQAYNESIKKESEKVEIEELDG